MVIGLPQKMTQCPNRFCPNEQHFSGEGRCPDCYTELEPVSFYTGNGDTDGE